MKVHTLKELATSTINGEVVAVKYVADSALALSVSWLAFTESATQVKTSSASEFDMAPMMGLVVSLRIVAHEACESDQQILSSLEEGVRTAQAWPEEMISVSVLWLLFTTWHGHCFNKITLCRVFKFLLEIGSQASL